MGDDQFVGTVPKDEFDLEETLVHESGWTWNPIAALKQRGGKWSDGSWTYRDASRDVFWYSRWSIPVDFLTDAQVHLTVFEVEDGMALYAHYEPHWVTHPVAHYSGRHVDPEKGVDLTRQFLDDHDITYARNCQCVS